ncbi:MAG TPA: FHA domain-containing protein [Steroidobacteraceae bacterium]|nr:FHA domain-containing protein [Steroidobacteraceae bacterium]
MSSRPLPPAPVPESPDSDVEGTNELVVLDPAVYTGEEEEGQRPAISDTWVMPIAEAEAVASVAAQALQAERVVQLEGELEVLAATLRETQQLLARRDERLREIEEARNEAQTAHTQAEQRATEASDELSKARALTETTSARVTELERALGESARTLEERESASHAQQAEQLAEQQSLAARNRVEAELLLGDLARERAHAARYFESLRNAEGRRQIFEGLVTDLEREAEDRAAELVRLARELGGRDSRARELESELAQRSLRIGELEQQLLAAAASFSERDALLRDSRHETQGLHAKAGRLMSELDAAGERVRALEARATQHENSDARQQAEIKRLRTEYDSLRGELEAARQAAANASAQLAVHEGAVVQGRGQTAELAGALALERRRSTDLERELETVRGEMHEWAGALKLLQQERNSQTDGAAAAEVRVRELERRAAEQLEALAALRQESNSAVARARELEDDLRAAEDAIHRLEAEARSRGTRVEELERATQEWRAVYEEVRQRSVDPHCHPALREAARQMLGGAEAPEATQLPDGAMRLLIQTAEGGREIVHVLGRRTSIGRTPDNDLQIDAKYISRHHCVILAGPVQTIVEDLNSTNGVMVNGKRVARHALKDGDQVVIGRALYRFVVRKNSEKR